MIGLTRGKIAVEFMPDPDTSAGGIIIPDMAKERADQGIVKYVGPEVEDIQIGDHVLFSGYSGTTVRLEGEGVLIILAADVVTCKIEAPDTDIPGLYFRDNTGEYWTATREMVTRFIMEAVRDQQLLQLHNRHLNKPTYD